MVRSVLSSGLREHFNSKGIAKKPYETMADAQDAAERMDGSRRRPYHGYECGMCHKFHIGRKPAKGKRNK